MLTIVKITSNKAGYEVSNNFCLIRDAKKYKLGEVYVCKVLSRFEDRNGNDHFVVNPISDHPVNAINYDLASKIYNGHRDGIAYLLKDGCPDGLQELYGHVMDDSRYDIDSATEYEKDMYNDIVQDFISNLAQ